MRGFLQADAAQAVSAYLAWWELAGVDHAVSDTPVNWLRPPPAPRPDAPPAAAPILDEKPATLETFTTWLMDEATQPERRWPGNAIRPQGSAGASLMVITDMPDPSDVASGTLLADQAGQLFDAMLAAMNLKRGDIYLTSLFHSRPPGGMVEATDIAIATNRMRTHIALARPQRVLLLGDRTARAFTPEQKGGGLDHLQFFNHDGGTVPAFATFHPRLLLGQPSAKAECWRTLQRLMREQQQ